MNYEGSRCNFEADLKSHYIPNGVVLAGSSISTHIDHIKEFDTENYNRIPKEWKELDAVFSEIQEKYGNNAKWENLSEEDYGRVLEKLFALDEKGMISK